MDASSPFARFVRDRIAPPKGGRCVGYMGSTVPVELIEAAGLTPFALIGEPRASTPLADRYMEVLFDPRVRSVFEGLLETSGRDLELIVLPRTADSLQRCYYYLCELKRMGVAKLPPVKLYDLLHTPADSSARYNLQRTAEMRTALEEVAGAPISDAALAAAIKTSNARRRALAAMVALRRQTPARITGEEALAVFEASTRMPAAAFTAALEQAIAETASRAFTGPRVVIAGSGQDRPDLHRLVADLGGVVVGDHHTGGELIMGAPIDETLPPVQAISDHYHRTVASSRTFPTRPAEVAEFAKACSADAVIFVYDAEEEALTWDYPAQRRAVEAAGMAALAFPDQPWPLPVEALRAPLASFLSGLGAGVAA